MTSGGGEVSAAGDGGCVLGMVAPSFLLSRTIRVVPVLDPGSNPR